MSGNDIDPQLQLALQLLDGVLFKEGDEGPIQHRYLDGDREREARIALARLLHAEGHRRGGQLGRIFLALAMLFDPTPGGKEPREIVISGAHREPHTATPSTNE
jgi:hypothetical protein